MNGLNIKSFEQLDGIDATMVNVNGVTSIKIIDAFCSRSCHGMYTAWQIMVLYVENNKSTSIYAFISNAKEKYFKNDVGFSLGRPFTTHESTHSTAGEIRITDCE
jgi:hypothetical protein